MRAGLTQRDEHSVRREDAITHHIHVVNGDGRALSTHDGAQLVEQTSLGGERLGETIDWGWSGGRR